MNSDQLKVLNNEQPWYSEGLRFKCTECGKCCTGAPGYAWVTEEEIKTIAEHMQLSIKDFSKKYLRYVNGRYALVERKNYDCIFLKDKKCMIYTVRPTQCRTFPWWVQNLNSKEDWEEAAKHCEGINDTAPIVPFSVIESQLSLDKADEAYEK